MSKTCGTLMVKEGRTQKRYTPMDPFTSTNKIWTTSYNLSTTALYWYRRETGSSCRKRGTIETSGERGSGKCMLVSRHDDEDYIYICICIYIYIYMYVCIYIIFWNLDDITMIWALQIEDNPTVEHYENTYAT